ncbi:MAG: MarR family winged helix-turn-helix transcriptional regulator [Acidimicrobiales bacterium]
MPQELPSSEHTHDDAARELSRLIGQLRRTAAKRGRERFMAERISQAAIEVLIACRDTPGMRSGDLARVLGLAPNTTSTLIGQLVASGLLERTHAEHDRRVVTLTLTDEGYGRLAHLRDTRRVVLAQAIAMTPGLGSEEVAAMITTLSRIAATLEDDTCWSEA